MKNSWPLAKTGLAILLAAMVAQAGCDKGKAAGETKPAPATASGTAVSASDPTSATEEADGAVASAFPTPKPAPPSGFEFEKPVRIRAGEEFVSVESPGYACPTVADVDGDGLSDLVVGQFREGHLQFCKNTAGTGQPPVFAAAVWITTGESRAIVPGVW